MIMKVSCPMPKRTVLVAGAVGAAAVLCATGVAAGAGAAANAHAAGRAGDAGGHNSTGIAIIVSMSR
jgi:hypothetical protein